MNYEAKNPQDDVIKCTTSAAIRVYFSASAPHRQQYGFISQPVHHIGSNTGLFLSECTTSAAIRVYFSAIADEKLYFGPTGLATRYSKAAVIAASCALLHCSPVTGTVLESG
jgi:hypothetical protein